jgi:cytochrome b561
MTTTFNTSQHDPLSPSRFRYGTALVAVHWFMALLMVAVFASIELRVLYAKGTEMRDFMKALHFMLGLSVLLMVVLRLAARWTSPKPVTATPDNALQAWAQRLAAVGHLALYGFMLLMPLAGWLALSAAGKPIPFFGLELPALMAPNKTFAHDIKELHEAVGAAGYWLIGIHVAAALGHHYVLKDGLMSRMALMRTTATSAA